jgi:cytochrome c biogenesis protein CcmG, thiol:disulfide interchange protein DsbE
MSPEMGHVSLISKCAALAPVMLFGAIATGLGLSLTNVPHKMPSMVIDKPPPKFELEAVEGTGKPLSSSALIGDVMLLNVYASWCPVCRLEHPTLMKFAKDRSIPLYGINWKDKPGDGGRWLQQNGNPYLAVGDDPTGRAGTDIGVTGVPETFVIDAGGRIRYRHAGPLTEDVWNEIFVPLLANLRNRP